jgi:hypothetical protein
MNRLLVLLLLFFINYSFGQTINNMSSKIEFYLLKSVKSNIDTTKTLRAQFFVDKNDLEDTAFIKDNEILGYSFRNTNVKFKDANILDTRQAFDVSTIVTKRVENLKIPLGSGRQFALVVNGTIIYSGYFWNLISSWGCDGITAFANDTKIDILRKLPDYDFAIDSEDPRRNSILFECLLKTDRLHK